MRTVIEHTSIEPIAPRHAEAVQALASHPDVVATTNLPDPYPEDGAETWIAYVVPRMRDGAEYAYAIMKDGELVGINGLTNVKPNEAELGYWIGKPYWNQGLATAANRLLLDEAFRGIGLRRVYARPLKRNAASRRVLEKLGFTLDRIVPNSLPKWPAHDQLAVYQMYRYEWLSARS